jgi:hypothetical protein
MNKALRRRLSPGLVVACLALAIALGGTGYAAVVLPVNSVGTKQLKNGAVVASKVKPHSLVPSNFAQLPKGDKGDKGDQGLPGQAGAKGDKGDKGDPATKLFATVRKKAGGGGVELGPSSGVVTLTRQGNDSGMYGLTFDQDVSKCAVLAMPGGNALTEGGVTAQTTGGRNVTVETFNPTNLSNTDLDSFTVSVFC